MRVKVGDVAMSDKRQVQIIPPPRLPTEARRTSDLPAIRPPRINPGGIIDSTLTRWEANRHARTLNALSHRTHAETALFDAQTQAIASYIRRQRAFQELQELPEILATDRARRQAERAEELRDVYSRHEIAETRRLTELAYVERELLDAQQALKAQRDHGYGSYELEWKKRSCEILDVELSAAERRAILRQHLAELDESEPRAEGASAEPPSDAALDDALYETRAQLLANGLDTSRIDALLQHRRVKT